MLPALIIDHESTTMQSMIKFLFLKVKEFLTLKMPCNRCHYNVTMTVSIRHLHVKCTSNKSQLCISITKSVLTSS